MAMSRRLKVILPLALLLLVGMAGIALLFLAKPTPERISEQTAGLIQEGMSYAEVESIINRKPGNYSTTGVWPLSFVLGQRDVDVGLYVKDSAVRHKWTGRDGAIICWFSSDDRLLRVIWLTFPD